MKVKRWAAAILIGALLCVPSALAVEVREETQPEKADTLLLPSAASSQLVQDAAAAGLLKYSTVTDWDADLTSLNMAELGVALYEEIADSDIVPAPLGTYSDCDALAVRKATAVGIMDGTGKGKFGPNNIVAGIGYAITARKIIGGIGFSTLLYEDELSRLSFDMGDYNEWYEPVAFLCIKVGHSGENFDGYIEVKSKDALAWMLALYNLYEGQTPGQPEGTTWQDVGLQTEPALEGTTFFIYTPEELAWIAQKSLAGTTFAEKTVYLKADIDLSAHQWIPIGSGGVGFQGVFEGGGHTISGLTVGSREWPTTLQGGFLIGEGNYTARPVQNVRFTAGAVYSAKTDIVLVYNAYTANCYSDVLVAGDGKFTNRLWYSVSNSYVRYRAEKNGYAGCYAPNTGDERQMTAAQMLDPAFCALLNEHSNQAWVMWVPGENGYPILSTTIHHPDKWWIGNAEPWNVDETDESVYLVYTPGQLAQVAKETNGGNSFQGKTVRLMSDLDLSGKQWTPIGTEKMPFKGTFDGDYHTITGLTVGQEGQDYIDNAGMFGWCHGARLQNVSLKNVSLFGGASAGGISVYTRSSTITNCSVEGSVFSKYVAGGLLGAGEISGGITGCSATVDVQGGTYVGAIAGESEGPIIDCYALGTVRKWSVSSPGGGAGGLVGYQTATTTRCYAAVDVKIEVYYTPGGLAGSAKTLRDCHWSIDAIHEQDGLAIATNKKRSVGGGTDTTPGNTLEELRQKEIYVGWDFDTIWAIDPEKNGGLPYLRWQSVSQQPVVGVTLDKDSTTLYRGEELYLSASISPANAANHKVTWTSSAPSVATVNEYGLVTAVDGGTAVITVTTEDGGFKDSCTVTVSKRGRPVIATVGAVVLKTESGQLLTQIPASGSFLAEASVTVQGQPSSDYYIMMAVYDTNGALCDLNYMRTRIGNDQPIAYAATIHNRPGKTIGKIKVMVLDGLGSLVPLGNVASWGD